jgi:hypothetical protein
MSGTLTRVDLRTMLRDKLACWPEVKTTLSGAINGTVTAAALASGTGLQERMLLEIESEILTLRSFTGATLSEVTRGVHGTTAAAHADGVVATGHPFWGWTDAHLNRQIRSAIAWFREGNCWTLVPKTNTWLANFKEFGLPAGVLYPAGDIVKKVELWDDTYGVSGDWRTVRSWRHEWDRIMLNAPLTVDTNVRLWIQQNQPQLADDTTVLDDDKYAEAIVLYATGRCMDELVANRSRYYEYSAALNDRASSTDELTRTAYQFFNQATIIRDQMSRPGISGYVSTQDA